MYLWPGEGDGYSGLTLSLTLPLALVFVLVLALALVLVLVRQRGVGWKDEICLAVQDDDDGHGWEDGDGRWCVLDMIIR